MKGLQFKSKKPDFVKDDHLNDKPVAIVMGLGMNGLSVCRSLGRIGFNVYVLLVEGNAGAEGLSRYIKHVFRPDKDAGDKELLEMLAYIRSCFDQKPFLFAISDRTSLFLSRYKDRLQNQYTFWANSIEVQEQVINKEQLYAAAERLGIPAPKTWPIRNLDDVEKLLEIVQLPVFVKPALAHIWKDQYVSDKVLNIDNKKVLREKLVEILSLNIEVMVQEIIPGADDTIYSAVMFMTASGEPWGLCCKRKLRQQPIGAGDGIFQMIVECGPYVEDAIRLVRELDYVGPATVEFRWDERDDQFKLMEINARSLACQGLIAHAGINLPYLTYCYATGKNPPSMEAKVGTKWIAFERDFMSFREGRRLGIINFRQWLFSYRDVNAFAFFAWDDPLPFLVRTAKFIWRGCKYVCRSCIH